MMNSKKLRSHTIVPSTLYVYREADRLLQYIIEDMGRPGYVLVARQMGKTNLLINAKRTLAGKEDAFVYIDLSNSFRSARECFRYIIDTAIETNPDNFSFLYNEIVKSRSDNDLVDHLEHLFELRKLLGVIRGKLVIILDEVDALSKITFSDTIFKHIRSVYFSRTNYPQLERLTYILSGVAEPSSLIKDPRISPFNIGQNILLGDFSLDEYNSFIQKSGLELDAKVIDRIYYWTNGNPRMTYDICSAIEDFVITNSIVDIELIDEVISNMYLSSSDQAPIDHIRGLIENDSEMLDAVISIKEQDFISIKKSTRRKLYLSGVVGPDFEKEVLEIKNRVLDNALSIEWLYELRSDENGQLVEAVNAAFLEGNYGKVISIVDGVIDQLPVDSTFLTIQHLLITACYNTGDFLGVIKIYEKNEVIIDPAKADIDIKSIYLYGLSWYYIKEFAKAANAFDKIVSYNRRDLTHYRSMLNMGSSLLNIDYANGSADSVIVFNNIVSELSQMQLKLKTDEVQELKNIAYYNLGKYYYDNNMLDLSKLNFEAALKLPFIAYRPIILYHLYLLGSDKAASVDNLRVAANIIIDNQLKPQEYNIEKPMSVGYEVIYKILVELNNYDIVLCESLVKYIVSIDMSMISVYEQMNNSDDKFDTINTRFRDNLYSFIFEHKHSLLSDDQILFGYYVYKKSKLITVSGSGKFFIEPLLKKDLLKQMDAQDANYMSMLLRESIIRGDLSFAEVLLTTLRKKYFDLADRPALEIMLIDYYEMQLMRNQSKFLSVFRRARNILNLYSKNEIESSASSFVGNEALVFLKESAIESYQQFLPLFENKVVIPKSFKNKNITVVYNNGDVVVGKYKKLESDIKNEKCWIISE
ncbi:AAA-like domain-containing protein [Hymenobacter lucidus]|uniref:AAA-like domain-containing protein n=1 Tax=Hymenobacter lucidus TaxID=2880930 RepID=A0ABS8ATZ0_9BACT|nr:AAA-like domain-containing protein [Hymenobacter lucidus]MCB2408841.1 AAA-like domain-containing protein [Hymenobacter lucidus]